LEPIMPMAIAGAMAPTAMAMAFANWIPSIKLFF
jgi:hypothetical protein